MSLKLNSKPFVPCSLGEVPVVETWLKKDATILVLAPITSRIDYFVALFPPAYSRQQHRVLILVAKMRLPETSSDQISLIELQDSAG